MSAASLPSSLSVRARVSGYLDAIHFHDGQTVRKGEPLFTIDRRPFEAALALAQANLDRARASLAFAEEDLKRGQGVAVGTVITQQALDQRTQAQRIALANVAAQEQTVRQAALDLEFTELRAPVDGRIGDRRVSSEISLPEARRARRCWRRLSRSIRSASSSRSMKARTCATLATRGTALTPRTAGSPRRCGSS